MRAGEAHASTQAFTQSISHDGGQERRPQHCIEQETRLSAALQISAGDCANAAPVIACTNNSRPTPAPRDIRPITPMASPRFPRLLILTCRLHVAA